MGSPTQNEVRDALIASEALAWLPDLLVSFHAGEVSVRQPEIAYKPDTTPSFTGRLHGNAILVPVQVVLGAIGILISRDRQYTTVADMVVAATGDEPVSTTGERWLAIGSGCFAVVLAERVANRIKTSVVWHGDPGVLTEIKPGRRPVGRDILWLTFHDGSQVRLVVNQGSVAAVLLTRAGPP